MTRFVTSTSLRWAWPAVAVALLAAACGEDPSFKDEVGILAKSRGVIVGQFMLRVAPGQEVELDDLTATIRELVPGREVKLVRRFEGVFDKIRTSKTRLDQLLKLTVEATGSFAESENVRLYDALRELRDSSGRLYFDRVDTDKFLLHATYDIVAIDDPGYQDAAQYYLDMIRWREAIDGLQPDELVSAVPVIAAVFDTGIDGGHEDLEGVMWQDPDDVSINGFDAFRQEGSSASDRHGHGTAVAGVIGAHGGNGKGIHGAAYLTTGASDRSVTEIMSIVVLDEEGNGQADTVGRAIYWAVARHNAQRALPGREQQKLILNLSLAGPFDVSGYASERDADGVPIFEDDLLTYATENDVLVVAAAGNESCGLGGACGIEGKDFAETYYYPCSYDGVLCVAASTHEDRLAGLSNRRASVGLTAPGWGIYTTTSRASGRGYGYYSGTSEATPLVVSAAAIIWSVFPNFTADEIKLILQKSAARIAPIQAEIDSGTGRLDLFAALQFARQLTSAGTTPDSVEPDFVETTGITPERAPDLAGDPYKRSANAYGEDSDDEQQRDLLSCGVVQSVDAGGPWLLLLLIIPIVPFGFTLRRPKLD